MRANDRIVIRVSALPGWPDCPRRSAARLFRQYVLDAGYTLGHTARGIGAAIGTAVHKSAAVMLDEKARTGNLPPASVASDCAVDELKEQVDTGETAYEPTGATRNRNEAITQVDRMARLYRAEIAPTKHPMLVEERLEAEIAPGVILTGQPDLVAREPGSIDDLKTGARLGNYAAQIGGYSLIARTPRPEYPDGLQIERGTVDFIQRVGAKRDQPPPVQQSIPLAEAEHSAANIVRHIEQDTRVFLEGDEQRRIKPGDPWAFMANPNSPLCSARWCPVYGQHGFCEEWVAKEDR